MKIVSKVQENAEDIYAEAQQINEDRAAAEEAFEDTAEEETFKRNRRNCSRRGIRTKHLRRETAGVFHN